jgi:hypothetical protein
MAQQAVMTKDLFQQQVAKLEADFGYSFEKAATGAYVANTQVNGRQIQLSWNRHDGAFASTKINEKFVTTDGETLVDAFREMNAIVATR